jgi:hypothetical protein
MNKLINFIAEILSILLISAVFLVVCFYTLRATHFFSAQQLENVTIAASLFVCFIGCVVVDKSKKTAQL